MRPGKFNKVAEESACGYFSTDMGFTRRIAGTADGHHIRVFEGVPQKHDPKDASQRIMVVQVPTYSDQVEAVSGIPHSQVEVEIGRNVLHATSDWNAATLNNHVVR